MVLRSVVGAGMLLVSAVAQADLLGVRVGLDYLNVAPEIQLGDQGFASRLVQNDARAAVAKFRLEHPLPLIPELAVRYQRVEFDGQQQLTHTAVLGGKSFSAGQQLSQFSDISQLDLTAYYEVLDNELLSIDAGITARRLTGDFDWQSASQGAQAKLDVLMPMMFVDTEFAVWGTDTLLFAGGHYGRYQGDLNYDWQLGVAWRMVDIAMFQLYLKAGWQQAEQRSMQRDHLDYAARYTGGFLGLAADF